MKGFGNNASTQKILVKGWLIPENRKYYRFNSRQFMMESLPMLLNMWLALATERFRFEKADGKEVMNALVLIGCLDERVIQRTYDQANRWIAKLKTDDQCYIEYCNQLLEIVKTKIFKGEYADLSGMIQNTWEYSQWMQEAGYLLTTTKLIDNWIHPLSEDKKADGETFLNLWFVASIIVGNATGRAKDGSKDAAIQHLVKLGVLDMETDFTLRLKSALHMDSEYLKLLIETKEALESGGGSQGMHSI